MAHQYNVVAARRGAMYWNWKSQKASNVAATVTTCVAGQTTVSVATPTSAEADDEDTIDSSPPPPTTRSKKK